MSLPERSSVWSASSLPGHRRVGDLLHADCDVHSVSPASGRADEPVTPPDDLILAAIGTRRAKRGYRRALLGNALDVLVVGAGPAGVAAGDRGPPARPRRAGRRQGRLPPRQDLRRRPHHRRAAPARRPRASTSASLPSYAPVTETVLVSPTGREVVVPLPVDGAYAGRRAARRARRRARRPRPRARRRSPRAAPAVTALEDDGADVPRDTRRRHASCTARWLVAADGHYSADAHAARRRGRRSRRPRTCSPNQLARVPPVLHRRRRPPPLGPVRGGLPPRLRVGVPGGRRPRQRRLRRAPRTGTPTRRAGRRSPRSGARSPTARACAARSGPTREPEGTRAGLAHPRRVRPARGSRTGARCSSATPPTSSIR